MADPSSHELEVDEASQTLGNGPIRIKLRRGDEGETIAVEARIMGTDICEGGNWLCISLPDLKLVGPRVAQFKTEDDVLRWTKVNRVWNYVCPLTGVGLSRDSTVEQVEAALAQYHVLELFTSPVPRAPK